ncbi:glycosyltransferase BC10-like [Apium graveolens]|uniref:glycosyltransferase BC10-like n=1 Tax=Apium graveolens TaxID=4045 RepID=UPI003D796C8D
MNLNSLEFFIKRLFNCVSSQKVRWGTASLTGAKRHLEANALLHFSNERFFLLSESCIQVYNFPTVYRYLIGSKQSFVQSFDDPSRYGRGHYSSKMQPDIQLEDWRKGSQWFEINRVLAIEVVSDTKYYALFKKYCLPACYPDEHYLPTYVHMFYGTCNSK